MINHSLAKENIIYDVVEINIWDSCIANRQVNVKTLMP